MAREQISLRVPEEVLERLDQISKLADMERSRLMVNILDEVSKSLLETKKVGLLQFSILLRDLVEWLNGWAVSVKQKKSLEDFKIK